MELLSALWAGAGSMSNSLARAAPGPAPALATLLVALIISCDFPNAPSRELSYEFVRQPENLVFSWPSTRLPVKFWTEDGTNLRRHLESAIAIWESQFLYSEFTGEVVTDSASANVRVRFAGPSVADLPVTDDPPVQVCSGVTTVPAVESGRFTGSFNVTVNWGGVFVDQDIVNCIARVTSHEIGHTLGIFAHSPDANDLMFTTPVIRFPSAADRNTVQKLYHTPPNVLPFDQ